MDNKQEFSFNTRKPIDNQERRRLPKGLRNGIIFFAVLILIGIIAYIILSPKPQNLDDEEPLFSRVREDSRIVDMEEIVNYAGASKGDYNLLINELEKYFDKEYPDEEYFTLVGETLDSEETEITEDLSPETIAAIIAKEAEEPTDSEEEPYEDEEVRTLEEESRPRIIFFEVESSSGKRFSVRIIPGLDSTKTAIEIKPKVTE